ncbi:piggyBac transposable element-derived protein 4-like, partial [Macrobrachium rosenbergii]|uniref:piggyBac transposable element-derived protein 4-like n=1 Tax=Macrobrachium rosenbergii TaxID=79674 RepID=UPI0034D65548
KFYNSIVSKFKSMYTPAQNVAIDESLLLYKGRLGWVQYLPLKRARFGIKYFKLYLLTENETDVYGTVRVSRKEMPSGLKREKLQRGGMVTYKRRKVTAIKWKDKKDVVLLSTVHNTEMVETEKG